jgi:hypothetical protein
LGLLFLKVSLPHACTQRSYAKKCEQRQFGAGLRQIAALCIAGSSSTLIRCVSGGILSSLSGRVLISRAGSRSSSALILRGA